MITMVRTDRLGERLLIPATGLIQVFATEIDPVSLLTGPGRYACLHVGRTGEVHFRVAEGAPLNPRASEALALLTDVSMVFSGNVVFTGVPGDRVYEVVQQLSKEGI